jgi:hypothetical protein
MKLMTVTIAALFLNQRLIGSGPAHAKRKDGIDANSE